MDMHGPHEYECEVCKVPRCATFRYDCGMTACMDCEDYNWGERANWVPRHGGKKYKLKSEGR